MPAEKTESAFCVLKKSNLDVKINQEPRVQARLKIRMHLGDKEPNLHAVVRKGHTQRMSYLKLV